MRRRTNAANSGTSSSSKVSTSSTTTRSGGIDNNQKKNKAPKRPHYEKRQTTWWSPAFWWEFFLHGATEDKKRGRRRKSKHTSSSAATQGFLGLNRLTVHGSLLLLIAMAMAMYFNHRDRRQHGGGSVDPAVLKFMQYILAPRSLAHSHNDLIPSGRTQQSIREIPANELILKIPRDYLIWDLDALRDKWIQQESLLQARIPSDVATTLESFKPLEPYVFLAVHLARLLDRVRNPKQYKGEERLDPVMQQYLKVLPTYEDFQNFHPIFWNATKRSRLRITSASHDLIVQYQQEMEQSYQALAKVSTGFTKSLSFSEFAAALLNVWTRSFGTGPLLSMDDEGSFENDNDKEELRSELQEYKEEAGIDLLTNGCHSMVPILDLYNHFGTNPNVGFTYNASQRAFVVTSTMRIPVGHEIVDSYGKHTEAHLFAKYGFVNHVTGTDYTQASLALYHPVYSRPMKSTTPSLLQGDDLDSLDSMEKHLQDSHSLLNKQMLRYLQFDDGYEECVAPPEPNNGGAAWELKRLKLQHLLKIARNVKRWHVFLSPRSPRVKPPAQTTMTSSEGATRIPKFVPSKVQFDANPILSTCRLIVLTHFDYDGNATTMLRVNLEDPAFSLPRTQGDALQFRELMCMLRFADMALQSFLAWSSKNVEGDHDGSTEKKKIVTVQDQIDLVKALNEKERLLVQKEANHHPSSEWQVAHLHLAEMQALQVVKEVSARMIQSIFGAEESQTLLNSKPEYSMREAPCPMSYQTALLKA